MFERHKQGILRPQTLKLDDATKKELEEKGLLPFYEKHGQRAQKMLDNFIHHMELYCVYEDQPIPSEEVKDQMLREYVTLVEENYSTGSRCINVRDIYNKFIHPQEDNTHD